MTTPTNADFFQDGPELSNQYTADRVLRSFLKRKVPADTLARIEPDLVRFGERVVTDIARMGRQAHQEQPKHIPFDPWGRRIDQVEVSKAWSDLDRVSAEEGMIEIGYKRPIGDLSRIYQFAKLYLFHPSSSFYSCPLAMTDGAARAIEMLGDDELKKAAFAHLTSRDPAQFWTSGQWMTERTGGSDVSQTGTVARLENGTYRLYGIKWFTSAVSSQMAMALARIEGAPEGSKGLSLFYVELRDKKGALQNIRVLRLKDKLGTKALPTAELSLEGAPARLVGGEGNGVRKIATLFNITRVYNSVCALGAMRRALALARDYARKRRAFGKPISEHPLHVETLAALEVQFEAAFHLTFHVAELLGKEELKTATPEESALLRILIPVNKLYTGKEVVSLTSECLEAIGGAAYIEDTGLPVLARDAQVFAIWEGTTNVLSLDMIRAIERENAFPPLIADCKKRLAAVRSPELSSAVARAKEAIDRIERFVPQAASAGVEAVQVSARALAMAIGRSFAATLLLDHAEWAQQKRDPDSKRYLTSAIRWCATDLTVGLDASALLASDRVTSSREIALL